MSLLKSSEFLTWVGLLVLARSRWLLAIFWLNLQQIGTPGLAIKHSFCVDDPKLWVYAEQVVVAAAVTQQRVSDLWSTGNLKIKPQYSSKQEPAEIVEIKGFVAINVRRSLSYSQSLSLQAKSDWYSIPPMLSQSVTQMRWHSSQHYFNNTLTTLEQKGVVVAWCYRMLLLE